MRNSKHDEVRFSRAAVLEKIDAMIKHRQEKWQFDRNNGTAQLRRRRTDEYEEACLAYGEIRILQHLREEIE